MQNYLKPVAVILTGTILVSSCRALIYNIPDISDYKTFPYREIKNSPDSIFYFSISHNLNEAGKVILTQYNELVPDENTLEEWMEGSKTAAFLIIRNDTILYSGYNRKYQEKSIFNLFSVTKAFISTLVGIAVDEGKIKNIDQPITDYIPELSDKEGFSEITIRHLLLHTSGLKFSDTNLSPFSDNARYYYGNNLRKLVLKTELYTHPGQVIHYSSVNVQLLALILERSTGTTLSSYLQEKIWKRIGMQYDATWSLDSKRINAMEKGFSCLNCTAIDLAKLGRLYLNNGMWNNKQILSVNFIHEALRRDNGYGSSWGFQYNFRLGPKLYESYYSRGLYGQLLYIYPKKNIVIVRIGEADRKYNPQFINEIVLQIIDQL